jgi:hypothetical protein
MARQSSLEGRLAAVLSKNLNRRGVPVALAAIALAIAAGIAVPIAMLGAADNAADAVSQDEESKAEATPDVEPQDEGPRLVVESGIHVSDAECRARAASNSARPRRTACVRHGADIRPAIPIWSGTLSIPAS